MPKAGTIELQSGRSIRLQSLRQWETYAGLLEGLPTEQLNQGIVERILTDERERSPLGEPYLIPPRQTPIDHADEYPFGTPAALPEISCVANFESPEPARDPLQDYSVLTVIWFQDDFAFPIDPQVLEQIRALDWEQLAQDFEN